MGSRRCECCGTPLPPDPPECSCLICSGDGVLDCCVVVTDTDGFTKIPLAYDRPCHWGADEGNQVRLTGPDIDGVYTWEVELATDRIFTATAGEAGSVDCGGGFPAFSATGPDGTVNVAGNQNRCMVCGCYCSVCTPVAGGWNSACCFSIRVAGFTNGDCDDCFEANSTVTVAKIDDCIWHGVLCGPCDQQWEVTLVYTGSWVLNWGPYTFTNPQTACCDPYMPSGSWTLVGDNSSCNSTSVAVTRADATHNVAPFDCKEWCLDLTLAGIPDNPPAVRAEPICHCTVCNQINRTYRLAPGHDGNTGWGNDTCEAMGGHQYCGWNYIQFVDNGGTIWAYLYSGTVRVRWQAVVDPNADWDGAVLTYFDMEGTPQPNYQCDFTGSTITVNRVPFNCDCANPCALLPPNYGQCFCGYTAPYALPDWIEIDVPDGYVNRDVSGLYLVPAVCSGVEHREIFTPTYICGPDPAPLSEIRIRLVPGNQPPYLWYEYEIQLYYTFATRPSDSKLFSSYNNFNVVWPVDRVCEWNGRSDSLVWDCSMPKTAVQVDAGVSYGCSTSGDCCVGDGAGNNYPWDGSDLTLRAAVAP